MTRVLLLIFSLICESRFGDLSHDCSGVSLPHVVCREYTHYIRSYQHIQTRSHLVTPDVGYTGLSVPNLHTPQC